MSHTLLQRLVEIYSPSTQETEAVRALVGWMAEHGLRAEVDGAGSAWGERGPADALNLLMLLGHIDTFPGALPVRLEDGILYGRGSVDAKGVLCAFAAAAARARIPDGWRVIVCGAVEEESATSRGARWAAERCRPTLCIIGEPSGAERITLGYKGRLLIDYSLTRPLAHTARPEPSVAASGVAFWNAIEAWANERNHGLDGHFDRIMPHLRSINTSTDHLTETIDLTIGFRLPPAHPPEEVLPVVQSLAEPGALLRAYGAERAYRGERDNALVRGMLAAVRAQGGRPGFVLKTGTSDMNVVAPVWGCPIIAYGPGDSALDHTPDENLRLDEYDRAIAVLCSFIEALPPSP